MTPEGKKEMEMMVIVNMTRVLCQNDRFVDFQTNKNTADALSPQECGAVTEPCNIA